jgi:hypothetical protein
MKPVLLCLLCLLAWPVAAQEEAGAAPFRLGPDVFAAGQRLVIDETGGEDAFLAAELVEIAAPLSGVAHVAGRRVRVEAPVGGLYAAGQTLRLDAEVAADAVLFAQRVEIDAPVGGDLRAVGSEIALRAPVGGTLFATAEYVTLDGVIAGDAAIAARVLEFGPDARIDGTLILYEDRLGDATAVPERVIPEARIERREHGELNQDVLDTVEVGDFSPVSRRDVVTGFITSVLFVAVLGGLFAALAPQSMAGMRRRVLEAPGRSLGLGFVTFSALIGMTVVFALTLVGLLIAPISILLAVTGAYSGYIVGAYALGAGLLGAVGRGEPDSTGDRVLAAVVGAVVAGLVGLFPYLGWIFVLALVTIGLGAIAGRLFRPRLFSDGA